MTRSQKPLPVPSLVGFDRSIVILEHRPRFYLCKTIHANRSGPFVFKKMHLLPSKQHSLRPPWPVSMAQFFIEAFTCANPQSQSFGIIRFWKRSLLIKKAPPWLAKRCVRWRGRSCAGLMIEINTTLLWHFPTWRQISYGWGSNILQDPTGTNAGFTGADLIDLDGNNHCFMRP